MGYGLNQKHSTEAGEVRGLNPWKKEVRVLNPDEAGARVLNQYGISAGARPERLSSSNMGSEVRGHSLESVKKTEAGTRPEVLADKVENWDKERRRRGPGWSTRMQNRVDRVLGAYSEPEFEWEHKRSKKAHWFGEYPRSRVGQSQKDIGKGAEGGEHMQTHAEVYECKEYTRYLGIDPGYEGEETHNAMLCPGLGQPMSEKYFRAVASLALQGYIWQRVPHGEWIPWWYLSDSVFFWEEDVFEAGVRGSRLSAGSGDKSAWSRLDEDGGRDQAKAFLNRDKAGHLASTNMGVPGARYQPEKDRGGNKAGALILDQYGGSQVHGLRLKKTKALGLNPKKTGAGTSPEHLPPINMKVPGAFGRSAYPQPI
ncbi:unnamed protein product [Symbiodinium sp. KB8]|nr:unnamed protein product [Symbiodinium sp. KB8]